MALVFVYNANSGKFNSLLDAGHKLLSPKTYACNLCALTFGVFSEQAAWKAFRTESSTTMEFYHKDEFEVKFPKVMISYPAILKRENEEFTMLFDSKSLEIITSLEDLIKQLKSKM